MEAKDHVLFAPVLRCLAAPDVEPPRKAEAVARRVAAAHDLHPLGRGDRDLRLQLRRTKVALPVERLCKALLKGGAVARHECDGNADEHVAPILHEAAMAEEREVRHGVGAHGKVIRAHDGKARVDREMHLCGLIRRNVKVGAKLGQMVCHVGLQLALQCTVRPVRRRDGEIDEGTLKHACHIRHIRAHESLYLGRHPVDGELHANGAYRIRPRHEAEAYLRHRARLDRHARDGVADEHLVKDLPDRLLVVRRIFLHRPYALPHEKLLGYDVHAFFHARLHDGRDSLLGKNLRAHLFHALGRISPLGKRERRRQDGNPQEEACPRANALHQNDPPTEKWTRPPSEPRP